MTLNVSETVQFLPRLSRALVLSGITKIGHKDMDEMQKKAGPVEGKEEKKKGRVMETIDI